MRKIWFDEAWEDYTYWQKQDKKTLKRINTIISNATGQPFEKVEQDTDRNYWLSAEDAVNYGIVNKIVSSHNEIEA